MSDQPLSDDELLSSHIDGELDAAASRQLDARLADEPELRRRLADLRAAEHLVAAPVPPLTGDAADSMIAAALAASGTAANVTDLAAAGVRRRVWPARVATAAAAVVALAIAVPALRAIDTGGDDSDSAGEPTSASFDEALDDDGDADTAGDMSAEASLVPSADGGMAADDSDAGDALPEDALADDLDDAEAATTDPSAYSLSQLRLFTADPSFDPLADQLGAFDSTSALSAAVSQTWSAYEPAEVLATTTTTAGEPADGEDDGEFEAVDRSQILDAAQARLDGLLAAGCTDVADTVIGYFDTGELDSSAVLAADYASASAAGAPVAVGLFRLPGDQAVLLVIDLNTCDVTDARLN